MYIGKLKKHEETPRALVITVEARDLSGRYDKQVYIPKSQIQIKRDPIVGETIYIPDWLIERNRIPWGAISEIEAISPDPSKAKFKKEIYYT